MGKVSKRLQNQIDLHVAVWLCSAALCLKSLNYLLTTSAPECGALVRDKHLLVDWGKLTWSDPVLKRKKKNYLKKKKEKYLLQAYSFGVCCFVFGFFPFFFFLLVYGHWKNICSLVVFCYTFFFSSLVTYGKWTWLENYYFWCCFLSSLMIQWWQWQTASQHCWKTFLVVFEGKVKYFLSEYEVRNKVIWANWPNNGKCIYYNMSNLMKSNNYSM